MKNTKCNFIRTYYITQSYSNHFNQKSRILVHRDLVSKIHMWIQKKNTSEWIVKDKVYKYIV